MNKIIRIAVSASLVTFSLPTIAFAVEPVDIGESGQIEGTRLIVPETSRDAMDVEVITLAEEPITLTEEMKAAPESEPEEAILQTADEESVVLDEAVAVPKQNEGTESEPEETAHQAVGEGYDVLEEEPAAMTQGEDPSFANEGKTYRDWVRAGRPFDDTEIPIDYELLDSLDGEFRLWAALNCMKLHEIIGFWKWIQYRDLDWRQATGLEPEVEEIPEAGWDDLPQVDIMPPKGPLYFKWMEWQELTGRQITSKNIDEFYEWLEKGEEPEGDEETSEEKLPEPVGPSDEEQPEPVGPFDEITPSTVPTKEQVVTVEPVSPQTNKPSTVPAAIALAQTGDAVTIPATIALCVSSLCACVLALCRRHLKARD